MAPFCCLCQTCQRYRTVIIDFNILPVSIKYNKKYIHLFSCRLQQRGQDENGRIFQMEQPEVLTFDDEMGEADALVHLQPTVTLKYE